MIWLASWPRSGNTLLRTLLFSCFGLYSGSVYPQDLGNNKTLEQQVGHIEWNGDGTIDFPEQVPLFKTHEYPPNEQPAIYVVRDGRVACVSMWLFYNQSAPLEAIIAGQHRFGTWGNHVQAWSPWNRPNTLLLRYEDLSTDYTTALEPLSSFLGVPLQSEVLPSREEIARKDGRWVRKKSDWRDYWTDELETLFLQYNQAMLEKMGYS
ncbi:sulfotransferase domain-containing protein [Spirulina sp. CS-785/01]|uniref:sulfotransferase domain-containing protein n=1 Tax=Spirulina sp. CS-785/01 TaxID=3021716 RepID=UPI002330860B|nr:sulfotransferase domain-containing protein [Spirulina sp. CS-785/01]MDB9313837.1 sulfotransferase domain-containing protein [Spirulina sp. CS-785/01]